MAKRALCIGINNYPGTHMDLAGCVNDAEDWAAELDAPRLRGHASCSTRRRPRRRWSTASRRRSAAARSGDTVVITYSGHGTYVPDINGDELDGLDEAPVSVRHPDRRRRADRRRDPRAVRRAQGRRAAGADLRQLPLGHRHARRAGDPDADDVPRPRFMPMGNWMPADRAAARRERQAAGHGRGRQRRVAVRRARCRASRGDLLLAGCKEGPNNFSYDAQHPGPAERRLHLLRAEDAEGAARAGHLRRLACRDHAGSPAVGELSADPQIVGSDAARRQNA